MIIPDDINVGSMREIDAEKFRFATLQEAGKYPIADWYDLLPSERAWWRTQFAKQETRK